ncbi:efflux RND transporter periplasmic adaptor subunit [Pendulispora albinea]|uniref:Efflux RND transporter periplasmic adaptor subunit n=1 Tax=Pendulispora albinea TaxID=2741071 RepID=A0ABZ2LZG0_9BACT
MSLNVRSAESPVSGLPKSGTSRSTRVTIALGVLLTLGFLGVLGARVKQAVAKKHHVAEERVAAQAMAAQKAPSRAVYPEPARFRPRIEITGTLRPWRDADVGFELAGRLVKVNVATGDQVKEKTVLAVLDASRAGAQLSEAEAKTRASQANLALAQDALRRTEALSNAKSIPEAQAEQARQQVALAKAQLEAARATQRLARTGKGDHTIVAPFPGLVTKAPTAAGGVVQAGVPLVRIEDLSRFRLSATVSEDDALLVRPGTEVQVSTRDRTVTGRVTTLVPSLDQATRRAPIEIEVKNDAKLLAWSFVRATIDAGRDVDALRVPGNARRPGSQSELVTVRDGRAHITRVIATTAPDGTWLVREGLAATDMVLLDPSADVKEGESVLLEGPSTAKPADPTRTADVKPETAGSAK